MKALILSAALGLLATPAFAQTLSLQGPTGQTATLSAAEVASLPRAKVLLDAHGEKHEYEGPLLIDLLAKVGAPTGKALRGPALANAVVVTATDGYEVVFGLAEADPGTRPNRIILADRADGKPLEGKDGAFRLVVEGDLRPARSARMVASIRVVPLGTAPAAGEAPPHKH